MPDVSPNLEQELERRSKRILFWLPLVEEGPLRSLPRSCPESFTVSTSCVKSLSRVYSIQGRVLARF